MLYIYIHEQRYIEVFRMCCDGSKLERADPLFPSDLPLPHFLSQVRPRRPEQRSVSSSACHWKRKEKKSKKKGENESEWEDAGWHQLSINSVRGWGWTQTTPAHKMYRRLVDSLREAFEEAIENRKQYFDLPHWRYPRVYAYVHVWEQERKRIKGGNKKTEKKKKERKKEAKESENIRVAKEKRNVI